MSINYLLGKLTTLLQEWRAKQALLDKAVLYKAVLSDVIVIKKEMYIVEKDIKAVTDAMGNAASLVMFDKLWQVASDKELPSQIRYAALVALKRLVPWRAADVSDQSCVIYFSNC